MKRYRRYSRADKLRILDEVKQATDAGATGKDACAAAGTSWAQVGIWAEAEGITFSVSRQPHRPRPAATRYVMADAAFRSHLSLMALLGSIASQAVEDAIDGVGDALAWLTSIEAEMITDLINSVAGRELISTHKLARLHARRIRRENGPNYICRV